MSRTVCLVTAYDGTEFHGWQRQPGLRTVQGVLEDVLRRVLRHDVALIGSGRTDAGVHAAGHVSSFATEMTLDTAKLRHAVGSRLPDDLAVLSARDVHPDFHATQSATSKLYRYRIHHAERRPVELRRQRYAYHCWHALDVVRMAVAARHFIGDRDFCSMTPVRSVRETTVRRVIRCDVTRHGDEVRIDVEGDGFLYNQVRAMVGTLMEVGRGRWAPDYIADILASRDRNQAGGTAPAHGLCLQWVRYPPALLTPPGVGRLPAGEEAAPASRAAER